MPQRRSLIVGLVVFHLVVSLSLVVGAEGLFSFFRSDRGNSWVIDPSDFIKLMEAIEGRDKVVQIANFGEMEILTQPQVKGFVVDGAGRAKFAGKSITFPQGLAGFGQPSVQLVTASKIRFTLNAYNINRFLSSLSIRAMLPGQVNGRPFYLYAPDLLICTYPATDPLASDLVIGVTLPSELEVPKEVDVKDLQDALLVIPGLPKGLKSQFASVTQNGRAFFTPDLIGEQVRLAKGITGTYTVGGDGIFKGVFPMNGDGEILEKEIKRSFDEKNVINSLWGMRFWADSLTWQKDGLVYMVMGELSQEEACEIAEMMI